MNDFVTPEVDGLLLIARTTAIIAHAGQVDKAGEPYWYHCEWVAEHAMEAWDDAILQSRTEDVRTLVGVVGWLHDVFEDTKVTPDLLRLIGIPERAITAITFATHWAGVTYLDFIEEAKRDPITRVVETQDITHHLLPGRPWQPTGSQRGRYVRALELLNS